MSRLQKDLAFRKQQNIARQKWASEQYAANLVAARLAGMRLEDIETYKRLGSRARFQKRKLFDDWVEIVGATPHKTLPWNWLTWEALAAAKSGAWPVKGRMIHTKPFRTLIVPAVHPLLTP